MPSWTRRNSILSGAAALALTAAASSRGSGQRRKIGVLGVPFNSSGVTSGVARAPSVLRAHRLIDRLNTVADVKDYGDASFAPLEAVRDPASGIKSLTATVSMVAAVQAAVEKILADGRFPLVLGGDCPVMLGALAAARDKYKRVGLLFIDGHEDAYPPHSSPTGEAADMEFGFAVGLYLESVPKAFAALFPVVDAADSVIIGARDGADLARDQVRSLAPQIRVIPDRIVRSSNLSKLAHAEYDRLAASGVTHSWLHTDLDALSSAALPAVDYPQPEGLSWSQLTTIARTLVSQPDLIGWDITIYNPDIDPGQKHAAEIVDFIVRVVGM